MARSQSGVPATRIALSAAPLIVPMSASISAAAAAGQPPRTTQSCGESSVRCLSASSIGPGIRDSLGSRHSVLSSPLASRARRSLHPCVPDRLQSLHFLRRRLGAAHRGFAIDEQKLRHDGTPDGFAYAGGGLSPALCEYNEQAATVRTPARKKTSTPPM